MLDRLSPRVLLIIGLALPIAGCTNPLVDSISVSPTSQSVAAGQTVQFTAMGTIGHGKNHPPTTQNDTDTAAWTSSVPAVAKIDSSGVATGLSAGTTTITASINGYTGSLTASATLTVTTAGSGIGTVSGITGLSIIPGSQSVAVPGETSQFIAIGTTTSGNTLDLTDQVGWSSSTVQIATVGAATGLATALTQGTTTITALYTNPGGGSTITGTATFSVSSGSTEKYTAVTIVPSSQTVSASGQTGQFIALATSGTTGLEVDVTDSSQTTWISSIPSIASITSGLASGNGAVTGLSQGSTTITAEVKNPDGSTVSGTATGIVTATAAPEPLLSLTIIPSSITVGDLQDTGNFLAIGTFSVAPYTRDVTNSPQTTWLSSFPDYFPVDTNSGGTSSASAGIVTAYATGSATIIAEYQNPDGTLQTATAQFNCPLVMPTYDSNGNLTNSGSCYFGQTGPLKATLTVYGEGLNTTNWLITASSATGTPDVIHCGPGWAADGGTGGSVCVAIYPIGTTVTLNAPAQSGVSFGGWTYNCTPTLTVNAIGPNECTINLGTTNATVGAIFN